MRRSVFFRRVLSLLLIAMLLWAGLTALFYAFISRPVFKQIKADELRPKAEVIADMLALSFLEGDQQVDSLLQSSYELFDAWAFVVDGLSGEIRNTSLPDREAASLESINLLIGENTGVLLSGEISSLWTTSNISRTTGTSEVLLIGVPVILHFGLQDKVIGAVFFVKPLDEMNVGLTSMNTALLLSSLIVFLLMILPSYLATARLIRPLRQMRDVALAMADGNFDVTADTRQRGEIGDLAATMNDLSRKLAASISELTLERNRLRQVLEGMNEGLLAVDRTGQITKSNKALSLLLPIDNAEATALVLTDLPDVLQAAFRSALDDNCEKQITLQRGDRMILALVTPLCEAEDSAESSGIVVGAVGLFRDVTEAERLEQTRRDYVANVSHELRTPLTAMRALVEPLRDGMVRSEADQMRYYNIMLQEIVRLSHLINDMLELSRLQSGTMVMPMSDINIDQLLLETVERVGLKADELGLSIELPAVPSGCPRVHANPDRVEQILVILLDNALKFTPTGGTIGVSLDWDSQEVRVSVTDSGLGIAPQDIDHVFDRFYKADKAHQQTGTGLGLAIAREILLQMGQRISVSSVLGQGSVFTFSLRRTQAI